MEPRSVHTTCCVVGGGPAGMITGFLLARAGIPVVVLEKHRDFFRDFRGDTLHPSTFNIMAQLGLLDAFLKVPHQEITELSAVYNGRRLRFADFSHLHAAKPALGLMPQWDFLNFITEQASKYPNFTLLRETNVTGLLQTPTAPPLSNTPAAPGTQSPPTNPHLQPPRITGVHAETPAGGLDIHASLVIGADGRGSTVRKAAGLEPIETGVPIDVLWFRLSRHPDDPGTVFGNFYRGRILILVYRGDYWQCGLVIDKGGFEKIKADGLENFRDQLTVICPFLKNRIHELTDWSKVNLLVVKIDHLETWYTNGLLCIGDAAHAMSPVGGVGINLAIQDAVATANILWAPLKNNQPITETLLRKVQKRR